MVSGEGPGLLATAPAAHYHTGPVDGGPQVPRHRWAPGRAIAHCCAAALLVTVSAGVTAAVATLAITGPLPGLRGSWPPARPQASAWGPPPAAFRAPAPRHGGSPLRVALREPPSKAEPAAPERRTFASLGVSPDLLAALTAAGITGPSPIQALVIPKLYGGSNVAFAAATGSGKTLAYLLPMVQRLKEEEVAGVVRKAKRPRAIVFVPTRELAMQVLGVLKALGHHAKVASCAVVGGEGHGKQRLRLEQPVDVVVATPGRLLEHWKKQHVYLSEVRHIVIDEVDTMLTQGFTSEIMELVTPIVKAAKDYQVVMATATLTRGVEEWLAKAPFPGLQTIQAPDVHHVVSSLRHELVETKGRDKLEVLMEVLRGSATVPRTMVFCNTVASVHAVEHHLTEAGITATGYHKDLPLGERAVHLKAFQSGGPQAPVLVCTDIGQRGLDIDVDHVVLFDFPLNPIDFLHRAGRTARMGKRGTVTSIVTKKDYTLARAIDVSIAKGLPLERLTGNPNDYKDGGRLGPLVGRRSKADVKTKPVSKPKAPEAGSKASAVSKAKEGDRGRPSPTKTEKGPRPVRGKAAQTRGEGAVDTKVDPRRAVVASRTREGDSEAPMKGPRRAGGRTSKVRRDDADSTTRTGAKPAVKFSKVDDEGAKSGAPRMAAGGRTSKARGSAFGRATRRPSGAGGARGGKPGRGTSGRGGG